MATPLAQQLQDAGAHQLYIQAGNLAKGLYFLVLQTGTTRRTERLVLTH